MKNQCRNFDCAISRSQTTLFDLPEIKLPTCEKIIERVKENYFYIPQVKKIICNYKIADILEVNTNY